MIVDAHIRAAIDEVEKLLDDLHVDADARRRLMGGTASAWLGLNVL